MTTSVTIEGQLGRKTSNALHVSFKIGPEDEIGEGQQGGADGKGKKLATLFGFKNGGTGTHTLTFVDGRVLHVQSRDSAPTLVTQPDGTEVAVIERGDTSVARSGGATVLTFAGDPTEAKTVELFRMHIADGAGAPLGRLDIIRTDAGWNLARVDRVLTDLWIWWDRAGQALKLPLLGVHIELTRQPTVIEGDLLLAAAVDMLIGLRPYITEMR